MWAWFLVGSTELERADDPLPPLFFLLFGFVADPDRSSDEAKLPTDLLHFEALPFRLPEALELLQVGCSTPYSCAWEKGLSSTLCPELQERDMKGGGLGVAEETRRV